MLQLLIVDKKICLFLILLAGAFCLIALSCQRVSRSSEDIPVYTYPPNQDQQGTKPESNAPVILSPEDNHNGDHVERNIVVDERNSIFSIGIPPGQREETEVIAQKPIDFWFEYLPAEAKLEVNGLEVQRDPLHWETQISYTSSATKFEYQISNTTGDYISYNLHLIPSKAGESVPVVVRQRWIP